MSLLPSMRERREARHEVNGWRNGVIRSIGRRPLAILQQLAMGSVDDPDNCDCDEECDGPLRYHHEHHREFNRSIWDAIRSRPGLMKRLRAACRRELRTDRNPDLEGGPWGAVISHKYAQLLLENFLCAKPTWC